MPGSNTFSNFSSAHVLGQGEEGTVGQKNWMKGEKFMFYAQRYNRDLANSLLERDKINLLNDINKNKNFKKYF